MVERHGLAPADHVGRAAPASVPSPRAATMTPNTPSLISAAQAVPRRVASRRSAADGVPPRCRWPRIVTRDSRPVSCSSSCDSCSVLLTSSALISATLALAALASSTLASCSLSLHAPWRAIEHRLGLLQRRRLLARHRALGHGDDAEAAAGPAALADRLGDRLDVVGDLGDQDHVGAARDAGAERQPAGVVAHHLDHDDAVMAVRRAVQPVDRVGRDPERGVEAEGDVGHGDVVVDRLGQGDRRSGPSRAGDRRSSACRRRPGRPGRRGDACGRSRRWRRSCPWSSCRPACVCGLSRLVPRIVPPMVRMPGQLRSRERRRPVLHQAAKAVAKADHVHAVGADRRLADAADRGVEPRAVTALRSGCRWSWPCRSVPIVHLTRSRILWHRRCRIRRAGRRNPATVACSPGA